VTLRVAKNDCFFAIPLCDRRVMQTRPEGKPVVPSCWGSARSPLTALAVGGVTTLVASPLPSVRSPVRGRPERCWRTESGALGLQGFALLAGFATSVLLARLLGGEDYGRYVYALAWGTVLALPAVLGFDRFVVRGIAVYEVSRRWSLMKGLLRRTNQLVLLSGTATAGVGCAVAILFLSRSLRWPFCVAMLFIPFTTLTLIRQGAMQAIGRVVAGQMSEYLIRPVITLGGIGVLEVLGGNSLTATSALAANVAGVAVAFAIGTGLLKRALPAVLKSV